MSPVICFCYGITVEELSEAVKNGAKTVDAVMEVTGAGGGCTSCHPDLEVIIPALVKKNRIEKSAGDEKQLRLF